MGPVPGHDRWGRYAVSADLSDSRFVYNLVPILWHAHGGHSNGKPLDTFGDGAVWSLHGQKIVTGGEGGITLTKRTSTIGSYSGVITTRDAGPRFR